jgi:hypothetical protein
MPPGCRCDRRAIGPRRDRERLVDVRPDLVIQVVNLPPHVPHQLMIGLGQGLIALALQLANFRLDPGLVDPGRGARGCRLRAWCTLPAAGALCSSASTLAPHQWTMVFAISRSSTRVFSLNSSSVIAIGDLRAARFSRRIVTLEVRAVRP